MIPYVIISFLFIEHKWESEKRESPPSLSGKNSFKVFPKKFLLLISVRSFFFFSIVRTFGHQLFFFNPIPQLGILSKKKKINLKKAVPSGL